MALGRSHQLPHFYLVLTPDSYGQYVELAAQYWANPGRSPAEATRKFAAIVADARDH